MADTTNRVELTLPEASAHAGHPSGYFTIRRSRFRYHSDSEQRFPLPTRVVAGHDVFDVQELILWDERRHARELERQAEIARRKALREADRAARASKGTT